MKAINVTGSFLKFLFKFPLKKIFVCSSGAIGAVGGCWPGGHFDAAAEENVVRVLIPDFVER